MAKKKWKRKVKRKKPIPYRGPVVCFSCSNEFGDKPPISGARYWIGICDCCGDHKSVTMPWSFGYKEEEYEIWAKKVGLDDIT